MTYSRRGGHGKGWRGSLLSTEGRQWVKCDVKVITRQHFITKTRYLSAPFDSRLPEHQISIGRCGNFNAPMANSDPMRYHCRRRISAFLQPPGLPDTPLLSQTTAILSYRQKRLSYCSVALICFFNDGCRMRECLA